MRSQDIQVGHAYALARNDRVKVTALTRLPNGKVLVRFETGVKAGETGTVMSRSLARPWGTEPPRRPFAPSAALLRALAQIDDEDHDERAFEVGDVVQLAGSTTPLEWTIVAIESDGRATVRTQIFEQEHTRAVPVACLERCSRPQLRVAFDARDLQLGESVGPPAISDEELRDNLRPIAPERELDAIMDNVFFSSASLSSYRRRYAREVSGSDLSERLRDEIKRRGFLLRDRSGEYGRIRVLHRFDIVLTERPSPERPAMIERMEFPRPQQQRRAKRRNPRRSRRAA